MIFSFGMESIQDLYHLYFRDIVLPEIGHFMVQPIFQLITLALLQQL